MLECKTALWCRSMEDKENRAINTAFETLSMSASEQWPEMWAEVTARLNFTPCFQVYTAEQMADTSRHKRSPACAEKSRNLKNSWFLLLKVWKSLTCLMWRTHLCVRERESVGGRASERPLSLQYSTPILLHFLWHGWRTGAIFRRAAFYF